MTAPADVVLTNVQCPDGRRADISIRKGMVVHTGSALPADSCIDCTGMIVLPGGIDMHVHMRGGERQRAKEDWKTGSMSALAGGVTLVVDQPNTVPPITSREIFSYRVDEALNESVCGFAVNGALAGGADLMGMWEAGAMAFGEIFAGPSSYGDTVPPPVLAAGLRRIRELGALATIHAEAPAGPPGNYLRGHDLARPADCEVHVVDSVASGAMEGTRLHFCHLSTADAVLMAKSHGASCEVTPHHLFLSREAFGQFSTKAKVNPPIRSEKERRRLWSVWESIDVIASDHAPHTGKEKAAPFTEAPSGIPGVETMLPLLVAALVKGTIALPSLMEKTSWGPARILGIPPPGFYPGQRGDFGLFSRNPSPVVAEELHSKAGWTPFEGVPVCRAETVVMGGNVVYRSGEFSVTAPAWYKGRGYNPG